MGCLFQKGRQQRPAASQKTIKSNGLLANMAGVNVWSRGFVAISPH
jgi:hypothetical protein